MITIFPRRYALADYPACNTLAPPRLHYAPAVAAPICCDQIISQRNGTENPDSSALTPKN